MVDNTNKIFWISSYPKSGNTWIRSILCCLFFTEDGRFNFDYLKYINMIENIDLYKYIKNKKDFKDLSNFKTLSKYWIDAQKKLLNQQKKTLFMKTHHSCINYFGNSFTSNETTLGFIYIVRDPRDIVVSYSNYGNQSLEANINRIKKTSFYSYNPIDSNQAYGVLLPWDQHVESWIKFNVPKLIIRYEDLLIDYEKIIRLIIKFLKNQFGIKILNLETKIQNIIKTTNFDTLKKVEEKYGFQEKVGHNNFFNSGKKQQWLEKLNSYQIEEINKSFKNQMKRFKYI